MGVFTSGEAYKKKPSVGEKIKKNTRQKNAGEDES
jgi:hypothetical protein